MKKLMIAAAAVAMAAVCSAATTNWAWDTGTSVLKAGYNDSAVMGGATVYLMLGTDSGVTSQNELLADLRDGTTSISDLADMAVATGTTDDDGKIPTSSPVNFSSTTISGDSANFYQVVVSADENYVYLSKSVNSAVPSSTEIRQSITTASGASTKLRDAEGTASMTSSTPGWYAIPEPTSGLLLLLGMASLALKRKQK